MKSTGHRAMMILVMLLVWVAPVRAADPDMVLVAPQSPVRGGDTAILDLYLHNSTDTAMSSHLPLSVPCRIDTGRTIDTIDAKIGLLFYRHLFSDVVYHIKNGGAINIY